MFLPKEYQKMSAVRRLCGVYGETVAESSSGKLSQTAFVVDRMMALSVNNGGLRTKMETGSSTLIVTSSGSA